MNGRFRRTKVLTLAALAVCTAGVCAGGRPAAGIVFGTGVYDFGEKPIGAEVRVEYRAGWEFLGLRPFVGLSGTTKGSVYSYFGLLGDINITERLTLIPSAAAGAYEKGNAKDLGSRLEFRTGGELSFRLLDGFCLGVAYHHISNAGIGRENPGLELLVATYSIPLP